MNKIKKTTFIDRFKNAVKAFKGKPISSVQFGVDVKRCDQCEYKNENPIRDNLLVTAGARAAYMHSQECIDIPSGVIGEDKLAKFVATCVDWYLKKEYGTNFDEYIEQELMAEYGGYDE